MKQIQEKIKKFCEENKLESKPEFRLIDLISELGEVSKEILKNSDYGKKELKLNNEQIYELKMEIGDTLFSFVTLANSIGVDLDEAIEMALTKYKKRLEKGHIGSDVSTR